MVREHSELVIKIEKLIYKLNTQFYSDIFDACNITRLYVKNKSMYDIFDQIRKSDEHYSNIIKDLYDKIVKVLSVMYYTININALITQNTNTNFKISIHYTQKLLQNSFPLLQQSISPFCFQLNPSSFAYSVLNTYFLNLY